MVWTWILWGERGGDDGGFDEAAGGGRTWWCAGACTNGPGQLTADRFPLLNMAMRCAKLAPYTCVAWAGIVGCKAAARSEIDHPNVTAGSSEDKVVWELKIFTFFGLSDCASMGNLHCICDMST